MGWALTVTVLFPLLSQTLLKTRFRETLECRLRPWQEKYHEMGQDVVNLRELKEDSIKVG